MLASKASNQSSIEYAVAHCHACVLIFHKSVIESCLEFQLFISSVPIHAAGEFEYTGSVSVKLCKAVAQALAPLLIVSKSEIVFCLVSS